MSHTSNSKINRNTGSQAYQKQSMQAKQKTGRASYSSNESDSRKSK
jgi:hypothetical protein